MAQSWLEIVAEAGGSHLCPLRMRQEWLDSAGPLTCHRCEREVGCGDLFWLAAFTGSGDVAALDEGFPENDTVEIAAEHLECASPDVSAQEPRCLTIGHGTRPIDEFLQLLEQNQVELLADIRTVPRSRRNPQFEKDALASSLRERGICYLHLSGLGGLRKARPDSLNTGWRNESFRGYADYMATEPFGKALEELLTLIRHRRTAIMCAESVPWRCHRSLVADALLTKDVEVLHIVTREDPAPHRMTPFAELQGGRPLYPKTSGAAGDAQETMLDEYDFTDGVRGKYAGR